MIFKCGIQSTRRENDIEIGRVGRRRRDQALRPLNLRVAKSLFLSRIAGQHQPFSEANRWRLASAFSMITNGTGLRASSRATLRPTRPMPQMMKWSLSRPISRSMCRLPKKLCSSNSSKAWLSAPTPNNNNETPATITKTIEDASCVGERMHLLIADGGESGDHHVEAVKPGPAFDVVISGGSNRHHD